MIRSLGCEYCFRCISSFREVRLGGVPQLAQPNPKPVKKVERLLPNPDIEDVTGPASL